MGFRNTVWILIFSLVLAALLPARRCRPEADYTIGPGDVLAIRVWGNDDLTRDVVVSPDGSFCFPLIGEVQARGRSSDEVGRILSRRLADGYLVDPQVEVSVKEYRSKKVYVLGEVVRPGAYPLESRASIIEIISKAGGLGENAGDMVEIIRARKDWKKNKPLRPDEEGVGQVIQVDLRGLLAGKLTGQDLEIRDGDTIFVPQGQVFYIFGQVDQPGKYRWEKELTVLKAVIIAGGFTDIASKRRIKIRRKDPQGEKKIRARLDTPVEPGDTVIVPESFF
ncbi:MAG: polysaccharide biosynthesis/export family protein [Deltaproteobacteria bacterium]|nr:polysaccharide biosynthesis/export family protein [Deltaproteobacteria bacterium]